MASTSVNTNTAASGATNVNVATETVNAEIVQRFKLMLGALGVDGGDISDANPMPASLIGTPAAYQPGYDEQSQGQTGPSFDPGGNMLARAQVLTDEGTFRVNFCNSSLAVSIGNVTLTNGSTSVAWALDSTSDVHAGDYVKLDADGESAWAQIDTIDSLTAGTLVSAYTGTGGTGNGSRALVRPFSGGGAIAVASGQSTITSSTTDNDATGVERQVDVAPLVYRARLSISQRIANQAIHIGLEEQTEPARWFARFLADGTTNTTIKCQTGRNPTTAPSASETEETVITLPNGATTAVQNEYRIEQLTESVKFYVNGINVATHVRSIPAQHDPMRSHIEIRNATGVGSATSLSVDYLTCKNHNKLEVGVLSDTEQFVARAVPSQAIQSVAVSANNTDFFVVDASQIRAVNLQITSVGGGGTVSWQVSNDGVTWQSTTGVSVAATNSIPAVSSTAVGQWCLTTYGARYLRVRTTAYTSGSLTVSAIGLETMPPILNVGIGTNNNGFNMSQVGGQSPLIIQPNGSTNRATVVGSAGPTSNTDYSAQAWAAASGSGATIANAQGLGLSTSFDVNLTAWTAGASSGLTVYLQESPDNGTTWYDIWQCEELTAVSRARIPAIPVGGRRRMRWVNRGGAATTATVTVTAMDCSGVMVKQAQWFDRTSGVGSGTAVVNTNSAAYNVDGCKALAVIMAAGTAAVPGTFQVQRSNDGTNWWPAGTATAISGTAANMTPLNVTADMPSRFVRVTCTSAGTSQVINAIHIYGTN